MNAVYILTLVLASLVAIRIIVSLIKELTKQRELTIK